MTFKYFEPGTRVVKIKSEPLDTHGVGDRATVVSRLGPFPQQPFIFGYLVEWDDLPGLHVFTAWYKLGKEFPDDPKANAAKTDASST